MAEDHPPPKLSRDETNELTERVVEVAESGLPLADGLWAASCEVSYGRVRQCLRQLSEYVQRGGTLEQAVDSGELPLPRYLAGLLHAGARSGQLVPVLTELTHQERVSRDIWRQLRLALTYPLTVLLLLGLVLILIFTLVIPEISRIYLDFDTELPQVTQSLIWFATVGWQYFAVAALVLVGLALLVRFVGGARAWARVSAMIPGLGPLVQWQGYAEFARLLRLLLLQAVPLPEALQLTSRGVRNASVAQTARELGEKVAQGQTLAASMQSTSQVPPSVIPMVRAGEQTGDLPASLTVVYELLEGRVLLRSRLLMIVLPPVVFLVVAVVAIALVFGLLGPMVSLVTNLS